MCMRSPSSPKYSMSVSGSTLASASTIASPCRHCRNARNMRSMSYCSSGFLTPGPLVAMMNGPASVRNAALLGGMGEFDKIAQRAIARIDTVIIRDVVPVVALRRHLKRHQPDRGDPQPVQIIETPHQPGEIADPVAIGIHIAADRQAVEDRVLVPEVVDHGGPSRWL